MYNWWDDAITILAAPRGEFLDRDPLSGDRVYVGQSCYWKAGWNARRKRERHEDLSGESAERRDG